MPKRQIPFLLLIAVTAVALAGITAAVPANAPWDKAPEQWTLTTFSAFFRILRGVLRNFHWKQITRSDTRMLKVRL